MTLDKRWLPTGPPPFVPPIKETAETPHWRAMSPSARCVYLAPKQRYSSNFKNNGRIHLSVREAAKEVGVNKDTLVFATPRCGNGPCSERANGVAVLRKMMKRGHDVESAASI